MWAASMQLLWIAVAMLVTGCGGAEGRSRGKSVPLPVKPHHGYKPFHRYKPYKPKCKTINEVLATLPELSGIFEVIERGPLNGKLPLPGKGPFTVFLPSNEFSASIGGEFASLVDNDLELSTKFTSGSIVRGLFTLHKVKKLVGKQLTSLSGSKLGIELVDGEVSIASPGRDRPSPIEKADIFACDGVIHILELEPGVRPEGICLPLREVPRAVPELKTVTELREASPVLTSDDKDFTVLAPSDSALAELSPKVNKFLRSNEKLLDKVRRDFVIRGAFDATNLKDCQKLMTVGGSTLITVVKGNKIQIEAPKCGTVATVTRKNVPGCNGFLYVIDKFLLAGNVRAPGVVFPPLKQCNLKRCFPPKKFPRKRLHPRYYGYKKRSVGHRG